ncbi:MAG: CoA pyrophosphatase [Sphingobacteriaceae bacterium]|nr:CoA pyrophosphatase [Sphingobacteriaceae bacterium]
MTETLPGEDAQYMMAPLKRQKLNANELENEDYRKSAVIILLCTDVNGHYYIPLTERFAYDGVHSGQVSLPGGKCEEDDEDPAITALRECAEEIGVEKNDVEILGQLTPLYIPVSKYLVNPIVGLCTIPNPDLRKNPREVKHIAKLLVNELMNENIVRTGNIKLRDKQQIEAPYFAVQDLKVWGATAMILSEFKTLLKTIS